tara:strand:+ start:541 stop:864 length:324 start_codon:yes stop_codon:yes gene_type:complete
MESALDIQHPQRAEDQSQVSTVFTTDNSLFGRETHGDVFQQQGVGNDMDMGEGDGSFAGTSSWLTGTNVGASFVNDMFVPEVKTPSPLSRMLGEKDVVEEGDDMDLS